MNTPDTEWEANMQVETLHSILADISSFEPDGEVYTLVEQAHTELAKLRTIILSRDTYLMERVRKEFGEFAHEHYLGCHTDEVGKWHYSYDNEVVYLVDAYLEKITNEG